MNRRIVVSELMVEERRAWIRWSIIALHPVLFCLALFWEPVASWPAIIGVSLIFCLLWEKVTDVLISTALLMIAVFPLALWIVSFSSPTMALNLRAWMLLLYVAYAFLFMLPQLGLTAIRRTLQKEKRSGRNT